MTKKQITDNLKIQERMNATLADRRRAGKEAAQKAAATRKQRRGQ